MGLIFAQIDFVTTIVLVHVNVIGLTNVMIATEKQLPRRQMID